MTLNEKAKFELLLMEKIDSFNDAYKVRIKEISIEYESNYPVVFISLKNSNQQASVSGSSKVKTSANPNTGNVSPPRPVKHD